MVDELNFSPFEEEETYPEEPADKTIFEDRPTVPKFSEMDPVTYQVSEALPMEVPKPERVPESTGPIEPLEEKNEYGITPWKVVREKPEFKALTESTKARAAFEYFDDAIAPHLTETDEPVDYDTAKAEFLKYNNQLTIDETVPLLLGDIVRTAGKTGSKVLGTTLGMFNSPLAFVWGSLNAPNIDLEQFNKLPWYEQALVSAGAGFDSAWRSATKEGDWGTLYGDYYKGTTGKTIEESLPDNAKWLAPTIELVANLVSDPLILSSTAANLARFKVPKEWIGKIPAEVEKNLYALRGLSKEKLFGEMDKEGGRVLEDITVDAFEKRKDYIKWWEQQILPKVEEGVTQLTPKQPDEYAKLYPQKGTFTLDFTTADEAREFGKTATPEQIKELQRNLRISEETTLNLLNRIPAEEKTKNDVMQIFYQERRSQLYKYALDEAASQEPNVVKSNPISKFVDILKKDVGNLLFPEVPGKPTVTASQLNKVIEMEEGHKALQDAANYDLQQNIVGKTFVGGDGYNTLLARLSNVARYADDREGKYYESLVNTITKELVSNGMKKETASVISRAVVTGQENSSKRRQFVPMAIPAGLEGDPLVTKLYGAMGKETNQFKLGDTLPWLERRFIDRFSPIKDITPETYEEARKFNSYKDQAFLKFQELQRDLKPLAGDRDIFTGYAAAHRMLDRSKRGLVNPGGISKQEAESLIRVLETRYAAKGGDVDVLRKAMSDYKDWTDKYILKEAYDSGIISKASYDAIKKSNEWYSTFEILEKLPDDLSKLPKMPSKEYFSVANQKIISDMVGSEKAIADPIEATIKKFANAQAIFARNKVANTFIEEANKHIPISRVVDSQKEFALAEKAGENPVLRGTWNVNEFDTVSRFKNGVVDTYLVPKEIADTLKQIQPWQAPKVIQAYNAVFRAAATTLNLGFAVGNAARDAFMAFVASPGYGATDFFGKFQKDWIKGAYEGLRKELGKPSLMDDYVKAGGTFGYSGAEMFEEGGKNLLKVPLFKRGPKDMTVEVLKSPLTLIEKLNSVIEAAPRLGTFDRLMKLGYTPEDAAMAARQVTIDFNRGGTWTKVVNQFIPFLNARVQAKKTLYDAIKSDPQGTLAKTAVSTVLPASGLYAWNRLYYDKEYDMIPDHIKDDYFVFITGMTTDKKTGKEVPQYFVVAKGDAGKAAWNPIEYALNGFIDKNPRAGKEFLVGLLSDTVSPIDFSNKGKFDVYKALGGLTPQIAKPILEDWANLSFYSGREIVPHYMGENKPPELQYKRETPELYKLIGQKVGVSPLRLQNYAANILASYGREGFSPEAWVEGIKGRVIKTQGDNIENKAFVAAKRIEDGYKTARAFAQEAMKTGDREAALSILHKWNDGLNNMLDEFDGTFKPYGIEARAGMSKSYRFDADKIRNVLKYKDVGPITIEEKYNPRLRKAKPSINAIPEPPLAEPPPVQQFEEVPAVQQPSTPKKITLGGLLKFGRLSNLDFDNGLPTYGGGIRG